MMAPSLPRTGSTMVAVKRSPGLDVLVESGVSNAACISVFAGAWSAPFGAGDIDFGLVVVAICGALVSLAGVIWPGVVDGC